MRNLHRPRIILRVDWTRDKDIALHILHSEFGMANEALLDYDTGTRIFKYIWPENNAYGAGHLYDRWDARHTGHRALWWFEIDRPNVRNGSQYTQQELQEFARVRALVTGAASALGVVLRSVVPAPWSATLPNGVQAPPPAAPAIAAPTATMAAPTITLAPPPTMAPPASSQPALSAPAAAPIQQPAPNAQVIVRTQNQQAILDQYIARNFDGYDAYAMATANVSLEEALYWGQVANRTGWTSPRFHDWLMLKLRERR